jgi:ABC-2 type transport system permease protein
MKRALLITLNEVKLYLQDKGDLAFGLLLPVLTFALMYGAFGGDTMFKATANIVNEDSNGVYSQQLIKQVDGVDGVSIRLMTAKEADTKLNRSDVLMVLYIPSGFSDTLAGGGQAELLFKQRGNGGTEGQILASIIKGAAESINQEFQAQHLVESNLAGKGISQESIKLTAQDYLTQERLEPAVTMSEVTTGGSPDFVNQFLPGIITMYVLFSISLSAQSIIEERRRGTLERLLTTRLTAGQMFAGKFISSVARGFIQSLILLALAYAVFQMFTPVSFLAALVVTLVFTAAAAGIGMIIASIARSENAGSWIGVVVTMFMTMMGGTFFEIAKDSVLATLSKVSLNTYANEAYKTIITQGGSLGEAWRPLLIMLGVAVAGLVISRLVFKPVAGGK